MLGKEETGFCFPTLGRKTCVTVDIGMGLCVFLLLVLISTYFHNDFH